MIRMFTGLIMKFPETKDNTLSVCVPTYQQARFLPRTVESILKQKTDFRVEIVISDDGSSDETPDVCRTFAADNPGVIRYIQRPRAEWKIHRKGNAYTENVYFCISQCQGEFGAFCEGDDYWTEESKLQRQVDHLRSHPEAAGCFHDSVVVAEDEVFLREWNHQSFLDDWELPAIPADGFASYSQRDVLGKLISNYHTASLVFRRSALPLDAVPFWLRHHVCDFFFDVALTGSGVLHYLPFSASAYRINKGGSWSQVQKCARLMEFVIRYKMLLDDDALCAGYGEILNERIGYFENLLRTEYVRDSASGESPGLLKKALSWFVKEPQT